MRTSPLLSLAVEVGRRLARPSAELVIGDRSWLASRGCFVERHVGRCHPVDGLSHQPYNGNGLVAVDCAIAPLDAL